MGVCSFGVPMEVRIGQFGRILVTESNSTTFVPDGPLSDERVREIEEGPVRGVQSHLSGRLVLHGSCVRVGRVAVAFVGPSRMGKSSLAAALVLRGADLVSDGMTSCSPSTLLVDFGLPRLKLTDEAIARLGVTGVGRVVNEDNFKHYVDAERPQFEDASAVLRVVYVLEPGPAEVREIEPQQQLVALLRNIYLATQLPLVMQRSSLDKIDCAISGGLLVRTLSVPRDWKAIDGAVAIVASDMGFRMSGTSRLARRAPIADFGNVDNGPAQDG